MIGTRSAHDEGTARMRIGARTLDRPLVLAPMEDVTDLPFRLLCKRLGADVVVTEFVKADDLVRGGRRVQRKLRFTAEERPLGIQLYGGDPDVVAQAALVAESLAPDFIDLNCGCWVPDVTRHGAGAALLRDLDRLQSVAAAVVGAVHVPVTLKTRLGWDAASIRIVEVARRCEDAGVRAVTVHCRTRAQGHAGRADWSFIPTVKQAVRIPIVLNGGIDTPADVRRAFAETGCDAVMIGRAAVRNPWIFAHARRLLATGETLPAPSEAERIAVFEQHLALAIEHLGERDAVAELRRHYAVVLHGMPDVVAVRETLRRAQDPGAVLAALARHCELFAPAARPAPSLSA